MKMWAIVTVKTVLTDEEKWTAAHIASRQKTKVAGNCPINTRNQCTDVFGEHHSIVVQFQDGFNSVELLRQDMEKKYGHVTRIEVIDGSVTFTP